LPEDPGLAWRALSVAGFLLLVGAFLANQAGRWPTQGRRYLGANALGAGILAAYSGAIQEWVFVALESFWCVASVWILVRRASGVKPAQAHSEQGGP